jgi:hypothetical protein
MNFAQTSFETETTGRDYTAPQSSPPEIVNYVIATLAASALALTNYCSVTNATQVNPAISRSVAQISIKRPMPAWMHEAFMEMATFSELEDGWDGPGSKRPSGASLVDALRFLKLLPANAAAPEALAYADGTAGWCWHDQSKYLTIHLSGDGQFAYYGECSSMDAPVRGVALLDGQSLPADLVTIIEA